MDEQLCPFVNALLGGDYQCQCAQQVTRRSGPSVLCQHQQSFQRCEALYNGAKSAALPVLGYEDDLLSMPHSIMVKIQYGTIAGLQDLLEAPAQPDADLGTLVSAVSAQYNGAENIPFTSVVPHIEQYRLQRRRSRN